MNEDELMARLLEPNDGDRALAEQQANTDKRDIELRDGDSGGIGGEKDARAKGFNSVEREHDWRSDSNINAGLEQELSQSIIDDGGYVDAGGERGAYGRKISTFRDKNGLDVAGDLVRSGAAMPTQDADSMQASLTGITRRALGYESTSNTDMNAVGQELRDTNDEFTSWMGGEFQPKIRDRRGTFSRAFDRGTDETKAALGGALNYIGESLGNDEWKEEGELVAFEHGVASSANKRQFESVDKVQGFGDAVDYVVETLGEAAPGLIVDAIATAGTVAVGAATGGTGAVVGAGLMGAMRATATRSLMKGVKAGLYAGPAVSGFAQAAGAMENRLDASGNEDHGSSTLASGLVGAATNALPFIAVMSKSLRATGMSEAAAQPVLDALAKPSVAKRLKDVMNTAALGAGIEGATSTAQVVIDEVIATEMGGTDWNLETRDIVEAGIRAVIGGGAVGGIASSLGNSVGYMRDYNEARRGADAEGEAVDAHGWKDDTVEESENEAPAYDGSESLELNVERVAKRKPKARKTAAGDDADVDAGVVGQGQFDSMTSRDVPNLKTERYDELRKMLEPEGKPLDEKQVGALVDSGTLTDEELASYSADSHYGSKTPLSGGYDKAKGDAALANVFRKVVSMSREGKLKLTDEQREKLTMAEDVGTDVALKGALGAINPEFNNIVYRNANKFDGRAMFRDYSKVKSARIKNSERIKKESKVEKNIDNAPTVKVPKGKAPTTKEKNVPDSTPTWIKEGRKPSKEELDESMTMLSDVKDKLAIRIRGVIQSKGKDTQAAKDIFDTQLATTRKQLNEVGQHYELERTSSLEADKLSLLTKIADSSENGTTAKTEVKAKAKPAPTTVVGKLDYLKRELGTRTASDGDMGKLLEAEKQFNKNAKDNDALDPSKLTPVVRSLLGKRDSFKDKPDDLKKVDALQARVDKFEFNEAYKKTVNKMYEDTAADRSRRELGDRNDQQLAYAERGEDGAERSIGDVQSTIDTTSNDLEVAANYTRRTSAAVDAYQLLRKVPGLNASGLVKFMRESVKPNERELLLGNRLPKRRSANSKAIDNQNSNKTNQFAKGSEKPPAFTFGEQEKRPDSKHVSEGTIKKLKEYLENDDLSAFGTLLSKIGILPKDSGIGQLAKASPEERLISSVRSSFASNKRVRNARDEAGQNRSDRGVMARDNESGKVIRVDVDAVTRWAMREDDVDFNDSSGKDLNFINGLSNSVLSGISALADLRLPDGRPVFSFDMNTIPDDSVVYRMNGDKLASVTMGAIRANVYHKGRKYNKKVDVVRAPHVDRAVRPLLRKIGLKLSDAPELKTVIATAEHAVKVGDLLPKELVSLVSGIEGNMRKTRTLSDLMPEDIGNVYRDEVSYDDVHTLVQRSIDEGKISEERGDDILRDARSGVFDKDYEQAAKDGGELTIKSERVDNEIANRDEISEVANTRGAIRKTRKTENLSGKKETATREALTENAAKAREDFELAKKSKGDDMVAEVERARVEHTEARRAMKRSLVDAIRRDDVKGHSKAAIRNAHGDLDNAPSDLLHAVGSQERNNSRKPFVNKGDFGDASDVHRDMVQAKHRLERLKGIKAVADASKEGVDVKAAILSEAQRRMEIAELALKSHKDNDVGVGTDISKGRKIQLNRKLMKVVKRNRGLAKKSMFRLLEMTSTRLERIHPDAALRADKFTAIQRNATEYYASRIGKDVGNNKAIQKGYEDTIRKVNSPERTKYEAFLKDLNEYTRKSDKSFESVSSKVHLDTHVIERNREGFLSILREGNVKNPESLLESILEGRGYPEFAIRPELSNPPRAGRKVLDPLYDKLKEGKFVDTDAPRHLLRLVNSATSWAAWNKTHGSMVDGKWDSNGGFNRIQSEVHTGNRHEFSKLYQGVTGRLGMSMSPKLRALNSAALGFQAATVLWFTGLASIPEVAATYARMRGDTDGMLKDAKSVLTSVGREQMYKVARDYDIITNDAIEHSLQEMYNMNDLSTGRVSQKIQGTVFKLNGQNYVTKMTRAIATKAAERYMIRAVEEGVSGVARLKELGVTAKDVTEFKDKADLNTPAGKRYRDAVHQFVNEAVTNPRATQLPLVANDPRFLLVTTLKKFFYGFYDNVHKSLAKGFKDKDSSVNPMMAVAVTAAVAVPLALVAETIREQIRYPFGRPKWQGERNIGDWGGAVFAATGLLGPATMAESIYAGTTYGNHPVVAAAGPSAQFAVDVATLEMQPSRIVPLANQIPWLAQPINEGVKNLIK